MQPRERLTALVEFMDKAVVFGLGDLKIQSTPPRQEPPFEQSWTIFVPQGSVDEAMSKFGVDPANYRCVLRFRSAAYLDPHQLVAKVAPGLMIKGEGESQKSFYQIFAKTKGISSMLENVTLVSEEQYHTELEEIQRAYLARPLPRYTR